MVASEQLKFFLSCLAMGFLGGACHDLFYGVVTPMKNGKWEARANFIYEIVYFLAFALAFVGLQARLGFPDPRAYLYFGILIGFWVYYKFFRIMLAFLKKVCYNIVRKERKRKNSKN